MLIVTDLRSQSKQALEKQKKEIQNEIKVIELKLSNSSKKKGLINGSSFEDLLSNAANEGIITEDKIDELKAYNELADDIINVDDFSQEEVDQLR